MKKSSTLLIAAALILTACGTMKQTASSGNGQRFQDGIYNNTPAFRTRSEKEESKSETQALVEKTKESPIYLFGDRKDTVMIPENMSAIIKYDQKLGGTVVTVGENPYDWRFDLENNYGYWYGPYSIGQAWYWSRHFSPLYTWSYAPWRYHGWYDPFYSGWYDPWYYSSWYSPWYYGGWYGWYDPWYYGSHWHHHHYAGWYGGWDPWGHGHHHGPGHGRPEDRRDVFYGSRNQTGSDRLFSSSTSTRGGIGRSSTISRSSAATSGTSTRADRGTSSRSSVVRTTPADRNNAGVPSRVSGSTASTARPSGTTVNRTGTSTRRPAVTVSGNSASSRPSGTPTRTGAQINHRRPASSVSSSAGGRSEYKSDNSTSYRSSSSTARQSSSSYERSSSSYNRSSSSSSSRSSYSSGSSGSSRSSYSGGGGGGGYSRSGGGSTGSRR